MQTLMSLIIFVGNSIKYSKQEECKVENTNQLDKLAEALSKAQAQIENAKKDTKAFNYKYADLAGVLDVVKKPLADNGLSVAQSPDLHQTANNDVVYILKTTLLHSSGQSINSHTPLILGAKKDMQELGKAITYARRYALSAMLGVAQEDDDAATISGKNAAPATKQTPEKKTPKLRSLPKYNANQQKIAKVHGESMNDKSTKISAKQLKRFQAIATTAKWTDKEYKGFLKYYYGIDSSKKMEWVMYEDVCTHIERNPNNA